MDWVWIERCVNKKYHNDKYVHLRISGLENNSSIDAAHVHPVSNLRSCFRECIVTVSRLPKWKNIYPG